MKFLTTLIAAVFALSSMAFAGENNTGAAASGAPSKTVVKKAKHGKKKKGKHGKKKKENMDNQGGEATPGGTPGTNQGAPGTNMDQHGG